MSLDTREVLTLQLGHYANFVGTHWWNIQESSFVYSLKATGLKEINHDVLFREGLTLNNEVTFTPRLIAVDLKGSLNALRSAGILYDVNSPNDHINWSGDVTLHKFDALTSKNEFLTDLEKEEAGLLEKGSSKDSQEKDELENVDDKSDKVEMTEGVFRTKLYDLDRSVSVWSDFLRLHLHPRSLCLIEDYAHNDEDRPFEVFGSGQQLMADKKYSQELEDKIHYFTEECDQLQGFHILFDQYNGFSGLTTQLMQDLVDDFPNKSSIAFGLYPPLVEDMTAKSNATRLINTMLSLEKLMEHCSLILPMSLSTNPWYKHPNIQHFPHIQYKPDLNYHSSAVLAASLDTSSLPYRQVTGGMNMSDITDSLNILGRKVASVQTSLPFTIHPNQTLVSTLTTDDIHWTSLTPLTKADTVKPTYQQSVVCRGISNSRVRGRLDSHRQSGNHLLQNCSTVQELMTLYYSERHAGTKTVVSTFQDKMKTVAPFPHIFSKKIGSHGQIQDTERSNLQGVEEVPAMTAIQSTDDMFSMLDFLHKNSMRINIKKMHNFIETGLEEDDWTECINNIASASVNYCRP